MPTRISEETVAAITAKWDRLLAGVASGLPIGRWTRHCGFTPDMVRAYRRDNPKADREWTQAREQSADAFMDEAIITSRKRGLDPQHARVRIDTLKWAAAKRHPKEYSDRAAVDLNVKTIDLTHVLDDAQARLTAARAAALGHVIEGAVVRVLEPEALTVKEEDLL